MSKILIVDDNPDIVELVASRLEINNYEVITAENGKQAILKAQQEQPDLILMDVAMPEMDGFEAGAQLQADPKTKNIPVIMVTAKGENTDLTRAINEVKAVGYIVKPFQPNQLIEKVEAALKLKGK